MALTSQQQSFILDTLDKARKPLSSWDLYKLLKKSQISMRRSNGNFFITPDEITRFLRKLEEEMVVKKEKKPNNNCFLWSKGPKFVSVRKQNFVTFASMTSGKFE